MTEQAETDPPRGDARPRAAALEALDRLQRSGTAHLTRLFQHMNQRA